MLFNILRDHGHLFSSSFWITIFDSVVLPLYSHLCSKRELKTSEDHLSPTFRVSDSEGTTWDFETSVLAINCLADLFVTCFNILRSQLASLLSILTVFIRNPREVSAKTGLIALVNLTGKLGQKITEDEWRIIFLALKDAIASMHPRLLSVLKAMDVVEVPKKAQMLNGRAMLSVHEFANDDIDDDNLHNPVYIVSRMKDHIAVQILVIKVNCALLFRCHYEYRGICY